MPIGRTLGRVVALMIGGASIAEPALAQTVVALNSPSTTVSFPRGKAVVVEPPDESVIASTLEWIDKQLDDAGRADQKAAWNARYRAQLTAKLWIADDVATGQTFIASGYPMPPAGNTAPLSCELWSKARADTKHWLSRTCRDLSVARGQAIEVMQTAENGVRSVSREYQIGDQHYVLTCNNFGPEEAELTGSPYIKADDSTAFFASFTYLGDGH